MSAASEFLTRDEMLSPPSLQEEIVEFEGWGKVLCGEVSGDDRAAIIEKQAKAMRDDDGGYIASYQKALLAKGILDATSPDNARVPLLKSADVANLMKQLGAGRIVRLASTIERLSGMGMFALEAAKGNSESGPSAAGSSE